MIGSSGAYSPKTVRTVPSAPGCTSLRPMNQESIPGPVAIAAQTSSGLRGHFGLSALLERMTHQVSSSLATCWPCAAAVAGTLGWTAITR